jgi:hypothetical protein
MFLERQVVVSNPINISYNVTAKQMLENGLKIIVVDDHTAHEVGQKNPYYPANKDGEKYADGKSL